VSAGYDVAGEELKRQETPLGGTRGDVAGCRAWWRLHWKQKTYNRVRRL